MSYALFPGLKQILEDKRIKRFGVPKELMQQYLSAEQFVIDVRTSIPNSIFFSEKDTRAIADTAQELFDIGLYKTPLDIFVVHEITENHAKEQFILSFLFVGNGKDDSYESYFLSETQKGIELMQGKEAKEEFIREGMWGLQALIVLLNTTGTIKEKRETKKSREPIKGRAHKKGSGGYTIIRPPEAHELEGCQTGNKVRPHFRRGHIRKLDPENKTKWIWVSPCFIHGEPETARKAYLVQT